MGQSRTDNYLDAEAFPLFNPKVIKALRERFPRKRYMPTDNIETIMFEEGIQHVINFMEFVLESDDIQKVADV